MCSSSGNKTHVLELGLTHRGIADIGDVQSVRLLPNDHQQPQKRVRAGQDLLQVSWEGHSISEADELYHTRWETISGSTVLKSPITGTIQGTDIDNPWIDADDYLLSMTATEKEVFSAFSRLVCEDTYNRLVERMPPGRFEENVAESTTVAAAAM